MLSSRSALVAETLARALLCCRGAGKSYAPCDLAVGDTLGVLAGDNESSPYDVLLFRLLGIGGEFKLS